MKYLILDKGEEKTIDDFEKNDFVSIVNLKSSKTQYKKYAQNTLNKSKNINLRLSEKDLQRVKTKAIKNGIPYQTLLSTLIHQYADDVVSIKI
ncbi:MAG: CopG family antitoxin [bacterium]